MAIVAYHHFREQHLPRLYWFLDLKDPRAGGVQGHLFEQLAHEELTTRTKTWEMVRMVGNVDAVDEDSNEDDVAWDDAELEELEEMEIDEMNVMMADVGSAVGRLVMFLPRFIAGKGSISIPYTFTFRLRWREIYDFRHVEDLPKVHIVLRPCSCHQGEYI